MPSWLLRMYSSSATGATVALDGAPGVAAPARLPNVPMGRHRVVVQAVERVAFAVDVDVRDGETARVEVPPLEPVRHRLQITARGVRSPYEISVSQGAAARRCVAADARPFLADCRGLQRRPLRRHRFGADRARHRMAIAADTPDRAFSGGWRNRFIHPGNHAETE
jgi:hypothetical protein